MTRFAKSAEFLFEEPIRLGQPELRIWRIRAVRLHTSSSSNFASAIIRLRDASVAAQVQDRHPVMWDSPDGSRLCAHIASARVFDGMDCLRITARHLSLKTRSRIIEARRLYSRRQTYIAKRGETVAPMRPEQRGRPHF